MAAALGERLCLPVIAKDAIKETLGGALGITASDESKRLGSAVFELVGALVRELTRAGVSVIAEGNFTTRSTLFDGVAARITQVHVTAATGVLIARLLDRDSSRHPVHYDREAIGEVERRLLEGEWQPLSLPGSLVQVDTTVWPDLDEVCGLV